MEVNRAELYGQFKDFDRSMKFTRVVSPTQFGRILTMYELCVNPEDLRLLCRKFADAATGDINYPAFVQCIDKTFVNYTVDRLKEYDCPSSCPKVPFMCQATMFLLRNVAHDLYCVEWGVKLYSLTHSLSTRAAGTISSGDRVGTPFPLLKS